MPAVANADTSKAFCCFCGKEEDEVEFFMAGEPTSIDCSVTITLGDENPETQLYGISLFTPYICDECVEVCKTTIEQKKRESNG